jgi:hypothetical protein
MKNLKVNIVKADDKAVRADFYKDDNQVSAGTVTVNIADDKVCVLADNYSDPYKALEIPIVKDAYRPLLLLMQGQMMYAPTLDLFYKLEDSEIYYKNPVGTIAYKSSITVNDLLALNLVPDSKELKLVTVVSEELFDGLQECDKGEYVSDILKAITDIEPQGVYMLGDTTIRLSNAVKHGLYAYARPSYVTAYYVVIDIIDEEQALAYSLYPVD